MLGDDYIVQHCLHKYEDKLKQQRLQRYITDALYAISNHRAMTMQYSEIEKSLEKPADERTGEQIKNAIMNKWNNTGGSDET